MKKIPFSKYQGTGNDFVIIDNRTETHLTRANTESIKMICDRKFGIGADGLILLENDETSDFKMVYYNADGNESTMCGNGGRCIVAFAQLLGVINDEAQFKAIDGLHMAYIDKDQVKLQMQDVTNIEVFDNHVFLDTGSPHHVQMEASIEDIDVKEKGRQIRFGEPYNDEGANVNFVSKISETEFSVRTYERGVEDETLSCGTGVTAVALAMHKIGQTNNNSITLNTEGGQLIVSFKTDGSNYSDIWLIGPARLVFKGNLTW